MTERPTARPPHRAYATIVGVFAGSLALAGGLARVLGRDPRDQTWLDLATLSMATFKTARTIVRDEVTSFIREPFVEGEPPHAEDERPVQTRALDGRGHLWAIWRKRPRAIAFSCWMPPHISQS